MSAAHIPPHPNELCARGLDTCDGAPRWGLIPSERSPVWYPAIQWSNIQYRHTEATNIWQIFQINQFDNLDSVQGQTVYATSHSKMDKHKLEQAPLKV